MRLIARTVYRAFPELDPFSDDECRIFVRNATAVAWRRAMRATVNAAALAGVVALEHRLLRPWISPTYPMERVAVLVLLALVTIGVGALLLRDLLLRLAIRRILGRGAGCPGCDYSLAGLPVSPEHSVTCPECARVTDVRVHASHCARGTDGLLRFLPGPGAQLPADRWWTVARARSIARWAAVVSAVVLVTLAVPMLVWEVRLRLMASAATEAAAALPPGGGVLRSATPAAAEEPGENALDALSDLRALCANLQDAQLLGETSDWARIRWFRASRQPEQAQQEPPLAVRTRIAAQLMPAARAAGLVDALERIGRSTSVRFPAEAVAEPRLLQSLMARSEAHAEAVRDAGNLAAFWMLDACARRDPAEAARAFRTLVVLCSVHGLVFPHPFSGHVVGPAQLLEHLAAVSRLPGGEEALRVARQAIERNLRMRFAPESMAALEARKFQEEVIRTFGDPAVLRWRVFPWVRTRAYEGAIGFRWGRGAPIAQDPPALAFDFEREWAASADALPRQLQAFFADLPWTSAAPAAAAGAPLPTMASAFVSWLPRWVPGVDQTRLADAAVACVLGIEEFRRANDRLPGSLRELVPAYLPVLPPRALGIIYRTVQHPACPLGYQLYSRGFDGSDDGCSVDRDYPIVGAEIGPPDEPLSAEGFIAPADAGASPGGSSAPGAEVPPN